MAKDRINIPVSVTGAEEGAQRLGQVQTAVEQVGSAQQTAAPQAQKLGEASQEAAKGQRVFNEQARTAVTSVLAQLDPRLAAVVGAVTSFARGIGQASLALLGLVGAGAALAAFVAVFQRLADNARRAEEAIKRMTAAQREATREAMGLQAELADELTKLGAPGQAREARAIAESLQRAGLDRAYAAFGAIGGRLFGLDADQIARLVGARIATGGGPEWPTERAARAALLRRLMAVPEEQARAGLAARLRDVGLGAAAERPELPVGAPQAELEAALERLKRRGVFSEREAEVAAGLLAGGRPEMYVPAHPVSAASFLRATGRGLSFEDWARTQRPRGAELTIGQIEAALREEAREVRRGLEAAVGNRPIIIQQVSIDTPYNVDPARLHESYGRGAAELLYNVMD